MSGIKIFTINDREGSLRAFNSVRAARSIGNGQQLWASPTELMKHVDQQRVTMDGMLRAFNSVAQKPVPSFKSKKEAVGALWELAKTLPTEAGFTGSTTEKEDDDMAKNATAAEGSAKTSPKGKAKTEAAKPAPKGKAATGSGDKPARKAPPPRTARHAGKRLFVKSGVDGNPRRAGTHGFNSFEVIRKAGAKGIVYEDYISKGGRPNDLQWDIDHKWVETK